jgi:RNA polymerase sigma-70 factor (ECF subfamily)
VRGSAARVIVVYEGLCPSRSPKYFRADEAGHWQVWKKESRLRPRIGPWRASYGLMMRMDVSEAELARAAGQGDRAAFAALLARVYDRLFAFCFRLTGSRAEAEDLTQDICAALPGKLAGFRGEAKFATWLYRVAVNAAHDRRRRQASHARAAEGWGDVELARRAEAAEAADATDWLITAMRALPEDLRDTLALVLDEMTHAEAGRILGVSEGTISWRVSEARKRLKALRRAET